ncbi:FecR family protein [Zobellia alginiliquefaciens]|uniref:FecR family protein n=1 Tax=Zobellia alginiliquefaciens TaxID=3032586 RepID=UPI0023E37F34|nr:FecR family protein [Zobellia alginiliquefaciens]
MLPEIENLIVKFLTDSATAKDLDRLAVWIENDENKKVFSEYVQVHYAVFFSVKEPDTKELLDNLLTTIKRENSLGYKFRKLAPYQYAASIALVLLSVLAGYFLLNRTSEEKQIQTPIVLEETNSIVPGTDKAILTLANGSQVILEKGNVFKKQNADSNGEQITYAQKSRNLNVEYNYLTIPRGGQFLVKLSDGTKVWLNSETQLKYPVDFKAGETRKVELVYGEAYFDVSPSSQNGGSSFVVYNQSQEVKVLGTEFNIKAYLEEANVNTTLVEGKVAVHTNDFNETLKPFQQFQFNKDLNTGTVKEVDVYNETAWKEGVFSFEDKSLKEMMAVLSRWYDVTFVFQNQAVENEEFIGVLRKDQDLEEILTGIKNFGIIKNYKIYEKKVILE